MTRMHSAELNRSGFDPVLEGKRYGLAREQALGLWKQACADSTDVTKRLDPERARRRFFELAAQSQQSSARNQRDAGRTSLADDDGGNGTRRPGDAPAGNTPGRTSLVAAEAQKWAPPGTAELAAASGGQAQPERGAVRGRGATKPKKAPASPVRALSDDVQQIGGEGGRSGGPANRSPAPPAAARRGGAPGGAAPSAGGRVQFARTDLGKLMQPIGSEETIEQRRAQERAAIASHEAARAHATSSLHAFVATSNQQADGLRGVQPGLDAQLRAGESRAHAQVDTTAQQQVAQVQGQVAQAIAQADAAAVAARSQIEASYTQSVAKIEASTTAARQKIDAAHKAQLEVVAQQQQQQLTLLGTLYTEAAGKFRAAGKTAGDHAVTVANAAANEYLSHMIHRDDSFLDGALTDNRCKARADAAKGVGEAYQKGLIEEAEKQIGKLNERRPTDEGTVRTIADQSRTNLETAHKGSLDAVDAAHKQALDAAGQTRTQLLAQVDSARDSTHTGLDRHGRDQARAIQQQATQLKQSISQQRQASSTQIHAGIEAAIAALHQGSQGLLGGLSGAEVPDPEALDQALAAAHEKLGGQIAQMRQQMTQGAAQSAQALSASATQGAQGMQQTAAAAIASATGMVTAARTSFTQMAAGGAQSLEQLATGFQKQTEETAKAAQTGFEGIGNGLRDTYGKLTQSFRDGAQGNADAVRDGLSGAVDKDMPAKITDEADKAAAQVQPRWKSVLKWVIIIAIILVVAIVIGPMVIGAVAGAAAALGASAGVATVVGAVVGGAIVGAGASAVTTMVDNAFSGRALFEGVAEAAMWGAIGGAVGGAVSSALGPAMKGMSIAGKLALQTTTDVVVDTTLSAIQGNLSWDSFAQGLFMSLLTNGVTAHPKVEAFSGKFEAAGNNFGKGVGERIRPPSIDTGGGAAPTSHAPAPDTGGSSTAPRTDAGGGGTKPGDGPRADAPATGKGDQHAPMTGKGDQNAPTTGKGDQNAPTTGKGDQNVPVTGKGDQNAPTTGKGDQNAPTTGKGDQNAPTTGKGDQDAPTTGKGDQDAPTTGKGDQDAPTTGKGDQDAPTTGKGDQDAPTTGKGDQDAPTTGKGKGDADQDGATGKGKGKGDADQDGATTGKDSDTTPDAAKDPTAPTADPKQPTGPGGFQSDAISLTGKGDALGDAVKWLKPVPGKLDVVVHGDADGFYVLKDGGYVKVDHRALAKYIKKNGGAGMDIRLISCGTGESPTSVAQHLSNKLGVDVTAPTDTVWIHPDGKLTIGKNPAHNTGDWTHYKPGVRPDADATPTTAPKTDGTTVRPEGGEATVRPEGGDSTTTPKPGETEAGPLKAGVDEPTGLTPELKSIRDGLTGDAQKQFDNLWAKNNGDASRVQKALDGMSRNGKPLHETLGAQYANAQKKLPSGDPEAVAQLPVLQERAATLQQQIDAARGQLPEAGVNRLSKRVTEEMASVNKAADGHIETTKELVDGSNRNLPAIEAELKVALRENGVTEMGKDILHTDADGKVHQLDIDVVSEGGKRWIEVKAKNPFGLESSAWSNPKPRGVKEQAELMLEAAKSRPVDGVVPEVVIEFTKGVSPEVADALTAMGVKVRGDRVAAPEVNATKPTGMGGGDTTTTTPKVDVDTTTTTPKTDGDTTTTTPKTDVDTTSTTPKVDGDGPISAGIPKPEGPISASPKDGITGGKVTHEDFLGTPANDADLANAHQQATNERAMGLDEQAESIATGSARSERDMLLAIQNGEMPRFIARVGPKKNFDYGTFANPNRPFSFAAEPADLRGISPAEAMYKVGWTEEWIKPNIGKEITICVLDTDVAIPNTAGGGDKIATGRMEWPELTAKALSDPNFSLKAQDAGIDPAELPGLLAVASQTPVKGAPDVTDPAQANKVSSLRDIINDLYGANELYTGMGATMSEDGNLGGREIMMQPNGTGLKLTPDNHRLVSLGIMTQAHYDALFPPGRTPGSPPAPPDPSVTTGGP